MDEEVSTIFLTTPQVVIGNSFHLITCTVIDTRPRLGCGFHFFSSVNLVTRVSTLTVVQILGDITVVTCPLFSSRPALSSPQFCFTVFFSFTVLDFLTSPMNRCLFNIQVVFLNITYFFGTTPVTLYYPLTDIPILRPPIFFLEFPNYYFSTFCCLAFRTSSIPLYPPPMDPQYLKTLRDVK